MYFWENTIFISRRIENTLNYKLLDVDISITGNVIHITNIRIDTMTRTLY